MEPQHRFKVGDRVRRTNFPEVRDFAGKSGTVEAVQPEEDGMYVAFDGDNKRLFFAGQISKRFVLESFVEEKQAAKGLWRSCVEQARRLLRCREARA